MSDLIIILYDSETKAEEARGNGFRQAGERDCDLPGGSSHLTGAQTAPAECAEAARWGDV